MSSLIGISGRIGSGKDTVTKIIQALVVKPRCFDKHEVITDTTIQYNVWDTPTYKNKKFARNLKKMVCLLLNCTPSELENRKFKERELGPEWWYWSFMKNGKDRIRPYTYGEGKPKDAPLDSDVVLIKPTPRMFMQLIGTECMRNIIHPNAWVNSLFSKYVMSNDKWIISDMRFINEFNAVKARAGVTIRIATKDGEDPKNLHVSETQLDNHEFDYIIKNDGTLKELVGEVKIVLKDLKLM